MLKKLINKLFGNSKHTCDPGSGLGMPTFYLKDGELHDPVPGVVPRSVL